MRFTLNYRGKLLANGKPEHKHEIRKMFHKQLKIFWKQTQLNSIFDLSSDPSKDSDSIIKCIKDFKFVPLICQKIGLVAEIEITLLRPEKPGKIVTQGGDIDNRLKTLFDALQIPKLSQIKKVKPQSGENPFFCLLEDDNLIQSVSVKTHQLLEHPNDSSEVLFFIHITPIPTDVFWSVQALFG